MTRSDDITDLLQAWSRGDSEALAKLIPLVDGELKRIAHKLMRKERVSHTLQTTALVNEALLSLIADKPIDWKNRNHFYGIVAWRMQNILIEYARGRLAVKRGEGAQHVDFDETIFMSDEMSEQILMLEEALIKLSKIEERKARVVKLRYFGGFTLEEIATILDVAPKTVERDWHFARSWLKREIYGEDEPVPRLPR